MFESELQRMYQAWMQGNEHYVRDWYNFIEWAAKWNGTTTEKILKQIEQCHWFKKGD
jgi:hypothetical protein